jgi:hypothetical protein
MQDYGRGFTEQASPTCIHCEPVPVSDIFGVDAGFMKQPPNLLRQESSSAATLVSVLLRMYNDDRPDHVANRQSTVDAFAP